MSEQELYNKYGYLMDEEHGHDTELLMDILKCNGVIIKNINNKYFVQ